MDDLPVADPGQARLRRVPKAMTRDLLQPKGSKAETARPSTRLHKTQGIPCTVYS